jgi:iron complex transport system substrate-binding protein
MFRVAPALAMARPVANGPANAEALMAARVDMAFVSQGPEAVRLNGLGIRARKVDFTDVPTMRASLRITAAAIGTPLAAARARDYEGYLDATLNGLRDGLAGLRPDQRPRVLHLASLSPLRADGAGTLIDTWITAAGGRNAALGLSGNLKPIWTEQIARWHGPGRPFRYFADGVSCVIPSACFPGTAMDPNSRCNCNGRRNCSIPTAFPSWTCSTRPSRSIAASSITG